MGNDCEDIRGDAASRDKRDVSRVPSVYAIRHQSGVRGEIKSNDTSQEGRDERFGSTRHVTVHITYSPNNSRHEI